MRSIPGRIDARPAPIGDLSDLWGNRRSQAASAFGVVGMGAGAQWSGAQPKSARPARLRPEAAHNAPMINDGIALEHVRDHGAGAEMGGCGAVS